MNILNQTTVSKFVLIGFRYYSSLKDLFFFFFLLVHLVTLSVNILIIWLVASNGSLQSPMYLFLTQLSVFDLILTTNIVPNLLYITWNEGGTISFSCCLTQFYFYASAEASECFLLTIMAYDRFLAICKPLRYNTLINSFSCIKLIISSWLLSFSIALFDIISVSQLDFCGPNVIDHFFCDLVPLKELSCSDTQLFEMEILILCITFIFCPLMIVLISYVCIVLAVLRISTENGRGKAFSTCSSHLAVVSIFFGTLFGNYVIPVSEKSKNVIKLMSLLYTVFTPMINPIIYSLRNKDIAEAMKKEFNKMN